MEGNNLYYPKYFKQGLWWLIICKNSPNITHFLNKDIIKKIYTLIVWSPIENIQYSLWLDRMEKDISEKDLKRAKQIVYGMLDFEEVDYPKIVFYFNKLSYCYWDGHSTTMCGCPYYHQFEWVYDEKRDILIQKAK